MPHEVPMEEVHEQIQHHAHGAKESWIGAVALCTAFMATFAAISALLSSETGEESLKENAAAFDQWAFYQAKSIKSSILENKIDLLKALDKTPSEKDIAKIAEYKREQEEIKVKAEAFTKRSELHGKCKKSFELALTLSQVSIAVAAISVLTKRKAFWFGSMLFGLVGVCFLIVGFVSLPPHEGHRHAEKPHSAPADKVH